MPPGMCSLRKPLSVSPGCCNSFEFCSISIVFPTMNLVLWQPRSCPMRGPQASSSIRAPSPMRPSTRTRSHWIRRRVRLGLCLRQTSHSRCGSSFPARIEKSCSRPTASHFCRDTKSRCKTIFRRWPNSLGHRRLEVPTHRFRPRDQFPKPSDTTPHRGSQITQTDS